MTHLRRRAFDVAAAASAVLLAATCALWVRSYWAREAVSWTSLTSVTGLTVSRGQARVVQTSADYIATFKQGFRHYVGEPEDALPNGPGPYMSGCGGFYVERWSRERWDRYSSECMGLWTPCWSLALLFAILPALRLAAWGRRRRHRLAAGRCARCGYDLRASAGRCPECGAVPAAAPPV